MTNQRETTVLWDKQTGKVLYNAIIWLDARTQETVDFLLKQFNKPKDCLQVCRTNSLNFYRISECS